MAKKETKNFFFSLRFDEKDSIESKRIRRKYGNLGFSNYLLLVLNLGFYKNSLDLKDDIILEDLMIELEMDSKESFFQFIDFLVESKALYKTVTDDSYIISSKLLVEHFEKMGELSEIRKQARLKYSKKDEDSNTEFKQEVNNSNQELTKPVKAIKQDLLDDTNHFPEPKEVKKQEPEYTVTNLEPQRNFSKHAQTFFTKLEEEVSSEFEFILEYKRLNNKQEKIAYKAIIDLCNSKLFDYLEHHAVINTVDILISCLHDKSKLNKQFFVTELWNEIVGCLRENNSLYEVGESLEEIHSGKDNPYPNIAKFEKYVDEFNRIKLEEIQARKESYELTKCLKFK